MLKPLLFALVSTLTLLGAADPSTKNYQLRDFNLGAHLAGPHLTEATLKGKGMTPKDFGEYAKKFKLDFAIIAGLEHAPFDVPRDGHCLIFNRDGKLIYNGQPNKGNAEFREAIKTITE